MANADHETLVLECYGESRFEESVGNVMAGTALALRCHAPVPRSTSYLPVSVMADEDNETLKRECCEKSGCEESIENIKEDFFSDEAQSDSASATREESVGNVMEGFFSDEADSDWSAARDLLDEHSSDDACVRTERTIKKKFSIAAHINIIRESSSTCYFCTICQRYFSHKNTARNHEFCGSGQKPFKCKLCEKRFVKKCDRSNHYRVHTGERPFVCSICDKSFQMKHKLSRHMRSHSGVKGDHKCALCPRTFISKEALKKHEVNKHNPKKGIQCKSCKKFFERNEERVKHKCIKPPKKKDLVCEICGKTFSKNWNLTVHLRIHKGQRPFKCVKCKKSFRLKQHLERHSAKHQTDADFECMLCKQAFSRKDNMIRHLKLNHPDRHLGVDLKDFVDRFEKTNTHEKSTRYSSKLQEGESVHLRPTIITENNFPNIRFAKMPSKSASDGGTMKKSLEDPSRFKIDSDYGQMLEKEDMSVPKKELSGVEAPSKNSVVIGSVIPSVLTLLCVIPKEEPVSVQRPASQSVITHSKTHNSQSRFQSNASGYDSNGNNAKDPKPRQDHAPHETGLVSNHSLPAPVPRNTPYLPVSVLRFKSSSESRTAVPKKNP